MKDNVITSVFLAFTMMIAGCASIGHDRDIDDPTSSLLFGYIDMDEAPTNVDQVHLKQVFPQTEDPFWEMEVDDGLVFQLYLPPGGYQMASFAGSGFWSGRHEYGFPNFRKNETSVRMEKPGIYFIGAFRYREVDTGFFEADKFTIEPIESPSELELLQRVAKLSEVRGTQWEARIAKRIAELRK